MFINNDGFIKLTKPFRKNMSWESALKFSVKKWEFILEEVKEKREVRNGGGTETCALCYKDSKDSFDKGVVGDCKNCPICLKTGVWICGDTPLTEIEFDKTETIQAEIDFLKSL